MPSHVTKRRRIGNALQRKIAARKGFKKAIKGYKKLKPSAIQKCLLRSAYGSGSEHSAHLITQRVLAIKASSRTRKDKKDIKDASETIGESAAEHYLRSQLEKQDLMYNPAGLYKFSASGVFNLVYLDPVPTKIPDPTYKPDYVIVLEAKGGDSECQDRKASNGTRVKQGTIEYANEIANLMAKSCYKKTSKDVKVVAERERRKFVGKTVVEAIKNQTGVYVGVRGGYTDNELYKPEPIFNVPF